MKETTIKNWKLEEKGLRYILNDKGDVVYLFCLICRQYYGDSASNNLHGSVAKKIKAWVDGTTNLKKSNCVDHMVSGNHNDAVLAIRAEGETSKSSNEATEIASSTDVSKKQNSNVVN